MARGRLCDQYGSACICLVWRPDFYCFEQLFHRHAPNGYWTDLRTRLRRSGLSKDNAQLDHDVFRFRRRL